MHNLRTATWWYLPLVILIAALFLFWNLGISDVNEWDEARNGVNAWHMYHNHDYVNNYYGNELDTWTAKPPLLIWLITGSCHLFGFNEFALRLPAALSAFLFFIVLFRLVRLFHGELMALLTCLILLSCRAVASFHMGRTGDYDSTLLLFLTCSVYCLGLYLCRGRLWGLYLFALFTGLAFYAKGTAGFLYIPGLILFLVLSGQFTKLFSSIHAYIAMAITLTITGSWFALVALYGKSAAHSYYGTKNSVEALFIHDTFRRLLVKDHHFHAKRDNFFFFHSIEVRMNMWHILYYLALLTGAVHLLRHTRGFVQYIRTAGNSFTLLAMCISLPVILLLNFSEQPWEWYLAPVWPFVAFIVARWMLYISRRWKYAVVLWVLALGFNLVKHFLYINKEKQDLHHTLSRSHPALQTDYIVLLENPRENLMLYIHFLGIGFHKAETNEQLAVEKGRTAIVYSRSFDPARFERIEDFDEYTLAKVK